MIIYLVRTMQRPIDHCKYLGQYVLYIVGNVNIARLLQGEPYDEI